MAKVTITEQYLIDIADAIRTKTGLSDTYYPSEMAPAILTISGSGGITPSGTISITENGTYNVTQYASASVNVPTGSTINNQNKSVIPSESAQTITYDDGYTGLGEVSIGAISSTYIGSGITRNPTPTVSGATVTIPVGYYSSQVTESVASGSAGTPTATKGTVSNNSILVTPKVTNSTGYITGGIKTGTAVSVTASELVSGNKSITANGTDIDVTNYATVSVSVPTGSTINNQNKSVTPTESEQSVTFDNGYTGLGTVTVGAISSTYVGSDITVDPAPTASGATVTIPAGYYSEATTKSVASGSAGTPSASKGTVSNHSVSVTPSVTNTTGYITGGTKTGTVISVSASELVSGTLLITSNGTKDVTNYKNVSVNIGSDVNNQDKTVNPTESQQSISADSGYSGLGTVTVNAISSTYIGSDIAVDPTPTASGAVVTIPTGYYSEDTTKSVSTTTHPNPTASINTSTGLITASHTQTAGYVSAGTTTGTTQLTTQAAKTITPSTGAQTAVAKNVYTLGAVTVSAVPTETKTVTTNGDVTPSSGKFLSKVTVNVPIGDTINNQDKSVTPSESEQSVTADSGYTGLGTVIVGAISSTYVGSGITRQAAKTITPTTSSQTAVASGRYTTGAITVAAIPSDYIIPTGTIEITSNGTVDVTSYASASVSISTVNNQNKTVSPTESSQSITADTGYTGLGTVTVNAISSTYVGSDIAVDPTPTASGATVTIPEGYYSESTTKIISNGSATTPATTVTATQSISIDTSTGEITATASGSKNVTPTVSAGYVSSGTAGTITVNGSDTLQLTTQAAKTVTPTESSQTAVAKNVYTTGVVTVGAISSTYVGSGITQRDSDDLTVSGATVTAPAGYYSTAASKSVSLMTLPTAAASSATSGYSRKATISRSTSVQYINIPTGYNSAGAYYQISAVPNGSVTAPSSISGSSASLTTGTNTLTLTKTVSVTPDVTTEGYISSGTAGNSSVSLTASVTTKAAATYNTSTSNQTIAAGTYLTGAQTIRAVTTSNLSAANIKSGVVVTVGDSADADRIASVTGTFTSDATATAADIVGGATAYINGSKVSGTMVVQKYYTGSSAPSSSLGNNGDIYIQA